MPGARDQCQAAELLKLAVPAAKRVAYLFGPGPSNRTEGRRLAHHIDKILKGANPGELPIEQPASLDLVINLKTASAFGLAMPQDLLLSARQVIE